MRLIRKFTNDVLTSTCLNKKIYRTLVSSKVYPIKGVSVQKPDGTDVSLWEIYKPNSSVKSIDISYLDFLRQMIEINSSSQPLKVSVVIKNIEFQSINKSIKTVRDIVERSIQEFGKINVGRYVYYLVNRSLLEGYHQDRHDGIVQAAFSNHGETQMRINVYIQHLPGLDIKQYQVYFENHSRKPGEAIVFLGASHFPMTIKNISDLVPAITSITNELTGEQIDRKESIKQVVLEINDAAKNSKVSIVMEHIGVGDEGTGFAIIGVPNCQPIVPSK